MPGRGRTSDAGSPPKVTVSQFPAVENEAFGIPIALLLIPHLS